MAALQKTRAGGACNARNQLCKASSGEHGQEVNSRHGQGERAMQGTSYAKPAVASMGGIATAEHRDRRGNSRAQQAVKITDEWQHCKGTSQQPDTRTGEASKCNSKRANAHSSALQSQKAVSADTAFWLCRAEQVTPWTPRAHGQEGHEAMSTDMDEWHHFRKHELQEQ